MGSCMSSTQPIIIPELILPQKLTEQEEKEVELLINQITDEIQIEKDEKLQQLKEEEELQQRLRDLNDI